MPPPRGVIDRQAPALDLGEIVDDLQTCLSPCSAVPSDLDLWPIRQYIAGTCSRPA
jgi:hypothetical protein